jgi:hypothetical protein
LPVRRAREIEGTMPMEQFEFPSKSGTPPYYFMITFSGHPTPLEKNLSRSFSNAFV